MASLPPDYLERVYAGVLGKMIGVYLGRPFEQWSHEAIQEKLGEIRYYVHDRLKVPLIVTDDDLSGTFAFIRAILDSGRGAEVSADDVADTWLNSIIENRSILWWGGIGVSAEHTAYLRLKAGHRPPASGSLALNGRTVAEEIGAQIFIDGWALVNPGNPERAAAMARRAASVSHDGEAIHGAVVLAAMEAQAFVEKDVQKLLDVGLSFIPRDSQVHQAVSALRQVRAQEPDWRRALAWLRKEWGYERYKTGCPMVPNHLVIHLGLLYGGDDFQRALMVTNTAGYDTDCNSGNLGCLLGIKNGLAGIEAPGQPDWRGPVADRVYVSTAEGGHTISDAAREAVYLATVGRSLCGLPPEIPKSGARFHFSLPGSVQGFRPTRGDEGHLAVSNPGGKLRISYAGLSRPAVAETDTFVTAEAASMPVYGVVASPILYPGQTVLARVEALSSNAAPVRVRLSALAHGPGNTSPRVDGDAVELSPGTSAELSWKLPDRGGWPYFTVGVSLSPLEGQAPTGAVDLDHLTWSGAPTCAFARPEGAGAQSMCGRQWTNAVDDFQLGWGADFHITSNSSRGFLSIGARDWTDYAFSARLRPVILQSGGLVVRYQGLRRHYALELVADGRLQLLRRLDGSCRVLWEGSLPLRWPESAELRLEARGERLRVLLAGRELAAVEDPGTPLTGGGVALVVDQGCLRADAMAVESLPPAGS